MNPVITGGFKLHVYDGDGTRVTSTRRRQIKDAGGRYTDVRGHETTRYVTLPASAIDLARKLYRSQRVSCLIVESRLNIQGEGCPGVFSNPRGDFDGYIERAEKAFLERLRPLATRDRGRTLSGRTVRLSARILRLLREGESFEPHGRVLIPDHCPVDPQPYPGGIEPGEYDVVELLRRHSGDPEVVEFIADMME